MLAQTTSASIPVFIAVLVIAAMEQLGTPATARGEVLFVTSLSTGTVGEYTTSGATINASFLTGLDSPYGIAESDGRLFVTNFYAGTVGEYTTSGATVAPSIVTGLSGPTGIAVSGANLFVTNYNANTIGEYTTSGTTINSSLVTGLSQPEFISESGGDLYVTNGTASSVGAYTTAGATINPSLIISLNVPTGIAASDGNLFVVNYGSNTIGAYSTSGATVNPALISGLGPFSYGLAESGGNLFVANSGGTNGIGTIGAYTTSGATVNASLITGLHGPIGVVIAPDVLVPAAVAGPSDDAYLSGTRSDPGTAGPATTISYKSLDLQSGSNYTLGPNEILSLDDGAGTFRIEQGAVFTGNGIVRGNIFNAGLVRIPIAALSTISSVRGGDVTITLPPTQPGQVSVIPGPTVPIDIQSDTIVGFTGANEAGGGSQGVGGAGGGAGTNVKYVGDLPHNAGTIQLDASLEVTGSYTQTSTGALRLFVGGANPGVTYSQLTVDSTVNLAGGLQIVLEPELQNFLPFHGETFDVIVGKGGITIDPTGIQLLSLVTNAGSSYVSGLGVQQTPFNSGISSDPDVLNALNPALWTYALVNNNTTLELTYQGATVPEPSCILLLGMAFAMFGARRCQY